MKLVSLRMLLVSIAVVLANPFPARAEALAEVRAADLRRITALIHAERARLDAVLADELTYGHADGRLQTKPELLAALSAGAVTYESYDGPPPTVRLLDEKTALLTGTAELRAKARGTRVQLALRYLAVYALRDDAWKLIAYQSTRLDPASP